MPIADNFNLSTTSPSTKIRWAILNGDDIYCMSSSKEETLKLWKDDSPDDADILVEIKSVSALKMIAQESPIDD